LLEHAAELFGDRHSHAQDAEQRVRELHAKIGELTVALANGPNANLVRRWVIEQVRCGAAVRTSQSEDLLAAPPTRLGGFVPVTIKAGKAARQDIRIENLSLPDRYQASTRWTAAVCLRSCRRSGRGSPAGQSIHTARGRAETG